MRVEINAPIARSCVHVGGAGNVVAVLMAIKQCITVIILINLCWFSFYVFTELTPLHLRMTQRRSTRNNNNKAKQTKHSVQEVP